MVYAEGKILVLILQNKKDKFIKLFKFYLINFVNKVEKFEKPTEVFQNIKLSYQFYAIRIILKNVIFKFILIQDYFIELFSIIRLNMRQIILNNLARGY